ncbi:inactive serine/threonine-protein kinase TEX14 isoform X1 [Cynoglossus semilaevis]|nr:inactive serine/threonine-protein kinase TEX14 isoform X1 [Cynoglossus semilaevis]XP_024921428.1 inactive serine/threonine-protein kinase TEX14 isoform X1 [Cynoglossus semilaevis]XP_024921429.1 inactive serine/threonine-protein kinase TEX14 isoform X1 [Cynoglossus semilaevis]
MTALSFLCPVEVGVVTSGGLNALLHKYTLEGNLSKLKKLLQTGVDVDCVNHLGQTPLFCAAVLGHLKVTELLLCYGADPNHRCEDWSTPLHAGVFSCSASVVSSLLDAGGDLRRHDAEGRTPFDWLKIVRQRDKAQMVNFLENCISCMQHLCTMSLTKTQTNMSTSVLLQPASLLDRIKTCGSEMQYQRGRNLKFSCTTAQNLGFGKVCENRPCQVWAVPASIPLISDCHLTLADDGTPFSFTCGSLTSLTSYSWRGSRVTVKKLLDGSVNYLDLLISEQDYCSQLFHPHLLQLMGVSLSEDLLKTSLVFEPVSDGTLHHLLHNRRVEFPVLPEKWLLSVMLQVCEGLQYLHSHGLVMRALSSHSVVLTELTVAKLTDLGFMVPSQDSPCVRSYRHVALPLSLCRWAAPEVVRQKPCTQKADLHSLSALIQELYTDTEPWGAMSLDMIKKAVDGGQCLAADKDIPQPYFDVVVKGLQWLPQERTYGLEHLCQILQQDIKRLSLEDQLARRLSAYPEPDLGPGITRRQRKVGKPLQSVVFRDLEQEDFESEDRWRHVDGLMYVKKQKEGRDCVKDCYTDTPSTEETETETETEVEVKLPQTPVDQLINTLVVDLKVSQELLKQANWSLDSLEGDQPKPLRRLREGPATAPSSGSSRSPLSSPAVGPPSEQYSLSPQRQDWTKNLKVQLQTRDWRLLDHGELDQWLSHYPPETLQNSEQDQLLQIPSQSVQTDQSFKLQMFQTCRSAPPSSDSTKYENGPDPCEETRVDNSGTHTLYTANTHMSPSDWCVLAELSSITCSPTEPEDKLSSRPPPPCNSTPRPPALTHTHTQTGVEATSQPPALTADSVLSLQGVFTAGQEDSEDQQERSPRCPDESSRETEVETDVKEKEEFEKMNNELHDVLQEEDVGEIDGGERSEDVRQDWGESQRAEEEEEFRDSLKPLDSSVWSDDTNRAHATLDEVLQQLVVNRSTHRPGLRTFVGETDSE